MRKLQHLVVAAGLASLVGCGGSSPSEACRDFVVALCDQYYGCLTDLERTLLGLPATEAACIVMIEANLGCDALTADNACAPNETYHGDRASACVGQIAGLECAQVRTPTFDPDVAAPACGEVCTVD